MINASRSILIAMRAIAQITQLPQNSASAPSNRLCLSGRLDRIWPRRLLSGFLSRCPPETQMVERIFHPMG